MGCPDAIGAFPPLAALTLLPCTTRWIDHFTLPTGGKASRLGACLGEEEWLFFVFCLVCGGGGGGGGFSPVELFT